MRRVALRLHDGLGADDGPLYVMNVTDVDDKIIARSFENGEDPVSLARRMEAEFWEDMDALNVLRPDVICRVSEHVEGTIVPYIERIVEGGMAYVIPEEEEDGGGDDEENDVYFDVRAFEAKTKGRTRYGKLAPDAASTDFFSRDNPAGEGDGPNDDGDGGRGASAGEARRKRDPRDFCLWKHRPRTLPNSSPSSSSTSQLPPDPVEPSSVSYPSPWGPGRPGWHVECSAMIRRLSEDFRDSHVFDVHAGGVDLKFPHHSNEIAQSEAYAAAVGDDGGGGKDGDGNGNGDGAGGIGDGDESREWIPHWIHAGHLHIDGRKMSKSLKNFVTIKEMLGAAGGDADDENHADDNENDPWTSPADDFRLWTLGLSGSYRGPATFSKERMEEARTVRAGWVRFLVEGRGCLDRRRRDDGGAEGGREEEEEDASTRLWGDEELELFRVATECGSRCREALLDDLDGKTFAKELTRMADAGLAYVRRAEGGASPRRRRRPEEPLRYALDAFRDHLALVGFSRKTVDAGLFVTGASSSGSSSATDGAALLDEVVAFRSAVRSAALGGLKKKKEGGAKPDDVLRDVLGLCDRMRDEVLPHLGVEVSDGKAEASVGEHGGGRGWRYCAPRKGSERDDR
ncbi:hypothetical protein ACHAWF_016492 [Thalassiosira exigua]